MKKRIISIFFTAILISTLCAQFPSTDIKRGFRNSPDPSKLFESPASSGLKFTSDKPRLDSITYKGYDVSTGSWLIGMKSIFEYSQSGAPASYSLYYWNFETIQWFLNEKIEREFNASGDLILEIKYSANYDTVKHEFIYNINGLISEKITTNYRMGVISGSFRDVYEYNDNNHLTRISHYRKNTGDQSWEYSYKEEYTMFTLGRITEVLITDQDVNADGIIDQMDWMRITFNYDTEGNMISMEEHGWNLNINDWRVQSKNEYTYNAEGQKLTDKSYVFNSNSNEFEIRWDDEWIYDSYGNNTTYIFREKNEFTGEWSIEKNERLFDLAALAEDYSMPYDLDFQYINKPIGHTYYKYVDSNWQVIFDATFYYSNDISNIVDIPDTAFLYAIINEGVDTNGDSLISFEEAESFSWLGHSAPLYVFDRGISDMTGIEAFVNLELLDCSENKLTSLDLSNNTALQILDCSDNSLANLNLSNNTDLGILDCSFNQLTSLYLSNNLLYTLNCSGNLITNLDLSNNRRGSNLVLSDMPKLHEVCVYALPYPPKLSVDTTNSPNIRFSDCSAPEFYYFEDMWLPTISVAIWENGIIYEVPAGTEKDIASIRAVCIDSIAALAERRVSFDVSDLDNGGYWLYARDSTGNISEPEAFTITGVGVENELSEQFRIFPNPVQNKLIIETNGIKRRLVEIASLNGQLIFNTEMEGTTHQIDLSSFQKGIYFITIRSKDFVTTRKIIKY